MTDEREPGPWITHRIGPVTWRSRRKRRAEFVRFDEALADFGATLLAVPPGRWIVRFVWWLNGKLGGSRGD